MMQFRFLPKQLRMMIIIHSQYCQCVHSIMLRWLITILNELFLTGSLELLTTLRSEQVTPLTRTRVARSVH